MAFYSDAYRYGVGDVQTLSSGDPAFVMRAMELTDDSRIIALSSAGNPAPPRKKARYLALLHRHAEKVALSLIAAV